MVELVASIAGCRRRLFRFGPVPGDDVSACSCYQQASCGGVGAVDEGLVVYAVRVWCVGDVNIPESREPWEPSDSGAIGLGRAVRQGQ